VRVLVSVARVAERNAPEDTLVGSAKIEGDVLANDEAAVAIDEDGRDEAVDREQSSRLRGGARRGRQREG